MNLLKGSCFSASICNPLILFSHCPNPRQKRQGFMLPSEKFRSKREEIGGKNETQEAAGAT